MDENIKELGQDLWRNKPVLIALVALVGFAIFILIKNSQSNLATSTATTTSGTPAQPMSSGTFVEGSGYHGHIPTIPAPSAPSSSAVTPAPTVTPVTSTPKVPIVVNTPVEVTGTPIGTANQPTNSTGGGKKTKTVTVTPWGTQSGSLWNIAQSVYGNGSLWPQIYNANKRTIGNDPNLIKAGQVLKIP